MNMVLIINIKIIYLFSSSPHQTLGHPLPVVKLSMKIGSLLHQSLQVPFVWVQNRKVS